jgi:hypothetical protein
MHAKAVPPWRRRAPVDTEASRRRTIHSPANELGQDRLTLTTTGQVALRLRHTWSDGTTHLSFDPVEFLERLAVLVPRLRVNLVLSSPASRPYRKHIGRPKRE